MHARHDLAVSYPGDGSADPPFAVPKNYLSTESEVTGQERRARVTWRFVTGLPKRAGTGTVTIFSFA